MCVICISDSGKLTEEQFHSVIYCSIELVKNFDNSFDVQT